MATTFPFAAAVWWDPKKRKLILDQRAFVPAALVVTTGGFAMVRGDGSVVAQGCLAGTSGVRSAVFERLGNPMLDLTLEDGKVYRIYFAPPGLNAPKLDKGALERIAGIVSGAGSVGHQAGLHLFDDTASLSDVGHAAHLLGSAIRATTSVIDLTKGLENFRQFQALLNASPDLSPS